MSQESARDLVALMRRAFEAASHNDPDAIMGFYAPDAVLDLTDLALGTFEGAGAIRSFLEEWWGTWGDHLIDVEEIVDLGHGVLFSPVREEARLQGSGGHVEQRRGFVFLSSQGLIERQTVYLDVDQARAAAERLAQERADGCEESTTPDLVELAGRQLDAANRHDLDAFMSVFAPDAVYDASRDGLGVYEGPTAISGLIGGWWDAFDDLRFTPEEVLDLGNGVLFAVTRHDARPVGSTGFVKTHQAYVFVIVEGLVARTTVYRDIDEARAAAERLAQERG